MLLSLTMSNFALIEQTHLEFGPGLHILSGDTGAGKSLIFEALHLLAGQRSDSIWVREGALKADLRCEFQLDPVLAVHLAPTLDHHELCDEENPMLLRLRRVIHKDGRSSAQINGVPVKASILRHIGRHCFLFHDQHQSFELLKEETQRLWLDRYAQLDLQDYKNVFSEWQYLVAQQRELQVRHDFAKQQQSYLEFQLAELSQLTLDPSAIAEMEEQVKRQTHMQRWSQQAQELSDLVQNDDSSVQNLRRWAHQISRDPHPLKQCQAAAQLVETALVHLEEAVAEVSTLDDDGLEPERIEFVQQTLFQIYELSRKHQCKPEAMRELKESLEQELHELAVDEQRLHDISESIERVSARVRDIGEGLSRQRQEAAPKLAQFLAKALMDLGIPNSYWVISVDVGSEPKPTGFDDVRFLLSSNQGHKPAMLAKVASGGELSRISLVLHGCMNQSDDQPVYCFDEIDTGVSGQVAGAIGQVLQRLARTHQVFCISHSPQVAARAGVHWRVTKDLHGEKVTSDWGQLSQEERQKEIARMLGTASKPEMALAKKLLTSVDHE